MCYKAFIVHFSERPIPVVNISFNFRSDHPQSKVGSQPVDCPAENKSYTMNNSYTISTVSTVSTL